MDEVWRNVAVGEVCTIRRDRLDPSRLPPGQLLTHYSIPAFDSTGGPVSERAGDLKSHKFRVDAPSVLVSLINPRIPRSISVRGGDGVICSTEMAVLQPRANAGLTVDFLSVLASAAEFRDELTRLVAGTTGSRQRVDPSGLLALRLDLPPLAEQDRIVDAVGALDASMRNLRAVGGAAVTALGALRRKANLDAPQVALSETGRIVMGESPDGAAVNSIGVGEPLLNGPTEFGRVWPTGVRQWTSSARRRSEGGDILICVRGATAGRMNRADQAYVIGRGLAAIRGGNAAETDWLWHALHVHVPDLLPAAGGTIFPNISGPALRSLRLGWPEAADFHPVVSLLNAVEELVDSAELALSAAVALRRTLLTDLLSGNHVIPDSYDRFLIGVG